MCHWSVFLQIEKSFVDDLSLFINNDIDKHSISRAMETDRTMNAKVIDC